MTNPVRAITANTRSLSDPEVRVAHLLFGADVDSLCDFRLENMFSMLNAAKSQLTTSSKTFKNEMLQITSKNLSKLSCQLRLIFSITIQRVMFVPLLIGKHESSPFHVGVLTNSSLASIQKLINV